MKIDKTITTIFIVPTLKIPRERLQENNFINGYIKDGNRDVQYENAVYLLFKPENLDRFREFLDEEYERTEALLDDYNYDNEYVVLVYKLDDEYVKDFNLIKKGKYSKTSPKFQDLFPKVIKIVKGGLHKDEVSLQHRIFNKTEDLVKFWEDSLDVVFEKEYELWYKFDEKLETLNSEKLCLTSML